MGLRDLTRGTRLAPALIAALLLSLAAPADARPRLCFGKPATKVGTAGSQTIVGTPGNDVIVALGGNDVIRGRGGNDRICAGSGNDTIDGGPGADRIAGGADKDTLTFAHASAAIELSLRDGTARGDGRDSFSGIERVAGSAFDDEITGSGTADRLAGGPGDDTLTGLGGGDELLGEVGNDFLIGGPGNDAYDGGFGTFDIVLFAAAPGPVNADLALGSATGEGTDTLAAVEGLVGGPAGDVLRGDAGFNLLFGVGGNDVLDGRTGPDLAGFLLPSGPVTANLGTGSATGEGTDSLANLEGLAGSPFADVLVGSADPDILLGFGGNDQLFGGAGEDLLSDDDGADVVDGGPDNDRIYAGAGNDQLDGGAGGFDLLTFAVWPGPAVVDLNAGTATGAGSDSLVRIESVQGSQFADTLTGSAVADVMTGLDGNDHLLGLGGNDQLDGDAGSDTLDGGTGADDTCIQGETHFACEHIVSGDPGRAPRHATSAGDPARPTPPLEGGPPLAAGDAPPGSASVGSLAQPSRRAEAAVPLSLDQGIVNCWLRFAGGSYPLYVEHPWSPVGLTTVPQEKQRFIPRLYLYDFGLATWVPVQDGNDGWGHWVSVFPNSPVGLITIPFGGPWIGDVSGTFEHTQGWTANNGWYFRMAAWTEWRAANGADLGHSFRWIDNVFGADPSGPWCFG